jgi:hypothetical protein
MPASLLPASPHTHNALDDAIEQGELFANVFEWAARRRRTAVDPRAAWRHQHRPGSPAASGPHAEPT